VRVVAIALFVVGFAIFMASLYVAIRDSKSSGRFLARRRGPLLTALGSGWVLAIAGIVLGMVSESA
jgi:hypothetical protein